MTWPDVNETTENLDESIALRIRRAEAAIAGLRSQFTAWAYADLKSIDDHFTAASKAADNRTRSASLEELRRIAHNIKGQGGTFGCEGMSAAAAELDALLKASKGESSLEAVQTLVQALWAAFEREAA